MKFGLLYEMHASDGRKESDLFWEALEQVKLAEEVGFDYVWATEHHFLPNFSSSSAPEVFLAAVSQHTSRIRIGQGVCILPYKFNHPFRAAERAATLDIMSKGRLDFGTGRSLSLHELEGFGVSPDDSRAMWDEAIRVIPQMWTEEVFPGFEGEHLHLPRRAVVPRVIQEPHPPMWLACTSPTSSELAGKYGLGTLSFSFGGPAALDEGLARRAEAAKSVQPVGAFVNNEIAGFTMMHCGRDDAAAIERGARAAVQYQEKFFKFLGPTVMTEGYREWRALFPNAQDITEDIPFEELRKFTETMVENEELMIGDPDRLTAQVKEYDDHGVTQVLGIVQMGDIPHEEVMDCIRLFGTEVIQRNFR
jgi:alkanesulfonate monooxygenase SsuD/methylene tetrahydromethanopterin reductase-like flavin-dependent oxidoreductase (luciferase family)